jgi:hypothetical protein
MAIPRSSLLAALTVCLRSLSRTSLDEPNRTGEIRVGLRTNRIRTLSALTEPSVASFLPLQNGSWKSSALKRASCRLISAFWLVSSFFGSSHERAAILPQQRTVWRRSFASVRLHLVRNSQRQLVSFHVPSQNSTLVISNCFAPSAGQQVSRRKLSQCF